MLGMSLDERKKYERERFNQIKHDKEGIVGSDNSLTFYAINSVWIEKWKNFIKFKGTEAPGEIKN